MGSILYLEMKTLLTETARIVINSRAVQGTVVQSIVSLILLTKLESI